MPVGLPLQQTANQSFTTTLDGNLYDLTVRTCNGVTTVSITLNGTDVVDNAQAPASGPIIPSQYLEAGNFSFLTANQQLPTYEQFTLTQSLFYFTAAELAAFRTPPVAASPQVPTVTESFFNPIAALPLRFSPVGYVGV
jgi:hypothetical protein